MLFLARRLPKFPIILFFVLFLVGCATVPKDFLKLSPNSLKNRELQTRQYDTTNEEEVIVASAGVLQDLGFTLEDSESELGLVVGSKERDATDAGQVALATMGTILAAFSGSSANYFGMIDSVQKLRLSVVTRPSGDSKRTVVRVTFQRIVWNAKGDISRMETLNDLSLYQGFFERLSKSIFLEAHKI